MPDIGYDIEDEKYHTWQIANWRSLGYRITSPKFEAGSWKWRILLFPFRNNNTDFVLIYLEFADSAKVSPDWHLYVQLALILWNPEESTKYIGYYTRHCYTMNGLESDWGFTRFYKQHKLFESSSSRSRPLIENGRYNITVLFRILKEPTDSQLSLDNFINYFTTDPSTRNYLKFYDYNSKKETVYQISIEITEITEITDKSVESISLALQKLFYQMQTSDKLVETTEFFKSMGYYMYGSFIQHDAQKFNKELLNILEKKLKNTSLDGIISKLFVGKKKYYIKYVNIDYEFCHIEDYYDIKLNIKGCGTLNSSFDDYVQGRNLNEYLIGSYDLPISFTLLTFITGIKIKRDWLKFDNDCVILVAINEVLDKNYGDDTLLLIVQTSQNQSRSAYILVYISEHKIDEILSPVFSENVITQDNFKSHNGFGLINLYDHHYTRSEISQFKILHEDNYSIFKELVASNFKIQAKNLIFWDTTRLLDGTIRPNFPISNSSLDTSMEVIKQSLELQNNELRLYMENVEDSSNDKVISKFVKAIIVT
ncbi:26668_t:CDS:2 [Gigaspora margarita]|uniref:26668_t:CDS:1 n=1 Tax=Gigaspora margarita TaxID=4874 RepID=A0ABN7URS2_GIGMA|nr:26668_t:CDS:2 [Gigaspora margarita]